MRDDFSEKTIQTLANRVGNMCSNPKCGVNTKGPHSNENKCINIGVAAHITAASIGGPRYNSGLSSDERKSISNGIWLCQKCSKIIDSDEEQYTVEILNMWKNYSEKLADYKMNNPRIKDISDIELIEFYSLCFSRPAFTHSIMQEGSMENLLQAIKDTILALTTGVLFDRSGKEVIKSYGIDYLQNEEDRTLMENIKNILSVINDKLNIEIDKKKFMSRDDFYCFNDRQTMQWFDSSRQQIINTINELLEKYNIKKSIRFQENRFRF